MLIALVTLLIFLKALLYSQILSELSTVNVVAFDNASTTLSTILLDRPKASLNGFLTGWKWMERVRSNKCFVTKYLSLR